MESADVTSMFGSWSKLAEEYLLEKAAIISNAQDVCMDKRYRGRGYAAETAVVRVGSAGRNALGISPDPERTSLEGLVRKVAALRRHLNQGDSQQAVVLWKKVRWHPAAGKWRQTLGERPPDASLVGEMHDGLTEELEIEMARARERLIGRWRKKRAEAVRANGAEVYKEFRDPESPPLAVLRRPDGTITGDISEMDDMLRRDWLPIFAKHTVHGTSPPDPAKFMDKYRDLLSKSEQVLPAMSLEDLKMALARMDSKGAAGLDGWKPVDFKALPDGILELLLMIYDRIESTGEWPSQVCWAGISLIPKGEGGEPLDLRPITVTTVFYRLWAAARVKHCIPWQSSWIRPGQHGSRSEHSTMDALAQVSLAFEEAELHGAQVRGVAIDLAKAFDNIPIEVAFQVLQAFGIDDKLMRAIRGIYSQVKRRFKIGGYVGKPFTSTNGILQGCPVSVMLLNALMAVLHRVLEPHVNVQSYVDDLTVVGGVGGLKEAVREIEQFIHLTDQRVNVKKTKVFGLGDRVDIQYMGETLEWATEVKLLGVNLRFDKNRFQFRVQDETIDKLVNLATRIRYSGLHFDNRARVIGTYIGSKVTYGIEILDPSAEQERRLRSAISGALWKKKSMQRAPGLMMTLVVKGHVADPVQIPHVRRMQVLRRIIVNDPTLEPLVNDLWDEKLRKPRRRGTGFIENLIYSFRRLNVKKIDAEMNFKHADYDIMNLVETEKGKWDHIARDVARKMVWVAVERDRVRSGDVIHIGRGLDRDASIALYRKCNPRKKGILRKVILGAVWTQVRRSKLPWNDEGPCCQHCPGEGLHPPEDLQHLWWACRAWDHIRKRYLEHYEGFGFGEAFAAEKLPRCLATYGLAPLGMHKEFVEDFIEGIQRMMIDIFIARYGNDGDDLACRSPPEL